MRSSTSVSVAVALLATTTARAFVQAPRGCVMNGAPPTRTHVRSTRVLQRPRNIVSTMFAGEEEPQPATAGTPSADGGMEAEGASVVAVEGEGGDDADEEPPKPMSDLEIAQAAKLEEIERLRAKEKFITAATGDFECLQCAFIYKPDEGGQGALPGTAFDDLPSSWLCPVCKAPKDTFIAQTKTIAGFEDNLKYGLGTNNMTAGQKNLLIFGSLAALFVLFIAGYALE